jgi:hypothetical protein
LGATSGTQVITSNGATFDFPITANAPGATVQLADALTMGSTRTFTHTAGGLDLNGFNLTAGTFSSSNTNVRSITSGAGQFYCTFAASSGTSVSFNANVTTNLTFADRPTINLTGNGSGTAIRQIYMVVGQTEALAPDVNVTAGTDTVAAAVTTNMPMRNLNFTGFSGVLSSSIRGLYGNLTLSPTMTAAATASSTTFAATSGTQVITSNGVTLDFPITVAAVGGTVQLADALTLGSTRTFTLSHGSLDLNGFNLTAGAFSSSFANVRSITSGAGQFYLTAASSSVNDVVVSLNTITNLTLVDRPTFNLSGNGSGTAIRQAGLGAFAEAVAPDINVTAGTDTAQIPSNSGGVARSINFTGFSGTWAVATRTIYGNLTASATMTPAAGSNATTFAATSGTQVITSNGVTLDFLIEAKCPGATVQLADALTLGSTRYFSLTAGGLDLNGFNLTTGLFSSSNANVRSITSGAGQFFLTGTSGVVWSTSIVTNLTMVDRPTINVTGASGSPVMTLGNLGESVVPTVNISTGAGTFGWDGRAYTLNFTGFSGTYTNPGSRTIYGNLTISATMTAGAGTTGTTFAATSGTQVITSNGVTLDFPITVAAVGGTVQLADALTSGSTRTFTLTNGSLNLNGFNLTTGSFSSANTNIRSITSGTGQFYVTATTGSIWNITTGTNMTFVDRPTVNFTAAPASGDRTFAQAGGMAFAPHVNVTAGSSTATFTTQSSTVIGNLNFAGFSGSLSNNARSVVGNWTGSAGMTYTAGANTTTFSATSGTQVITSNGVTLDFPITANCPGATVQLADALTMAASRALTLTGGTFDANNKNVTVGNFTAGAGATTRVTSMGAGTWTILDAGATAWSTPAAASHTVTPSTSTILMTAATAKTFVGGGRTFYNLSNGGAGALSITGANTYNDLQNTVTPATFTLPASTTTTVSALSLQGTSGNLVTLDSSTPATRATLSKASGTVDVSYLSIKDSAATGGASFVAVTGNGNIDAGNNTGWRFLVLRSFGSIIF